MYNVRVTSIISEPNLVDYLRDDSRFSDVLERPLGSSIVLDRLPPVEMMTGRYVGR